MSVDIVGSTAYKNRSRGDVEGWLRVFFEFHREVRIRLRHVYWKEDLPDLPLPRIWKSLGDEIIFISEVTHRDEIVHHLNHFKQAVRSYRGVIQEVDPKLDLKASAWVAGFPVANSVVFVAKDTEGEQVVADYVGPSIDVGFRISGTATPRQMTLSVELAYLLSKGREEPTQPLIYFGAGEALKGVMGGRPYPRIWTNMFPRDSDELEMLEDGLLGQLPKPCDPVELFRYTDRIIQTMGRPLFLPFLRTDPLFNDPPDGYDEQLRKTQRMWEVIYDFDAAEEPEKTGDPSIDVDELAQFIEDTLG